MTLNGIELDFLKEIREARPADCRAIIEKLRTVEGQNEGGELTPLGILTASLIEELAVNGIMMKYRGKTRKESFKFFYMDETEGGSGSADSKRSK